MCKISDLINELDFLKKQYGDVDVFVKTAANDFELIDIKPENKIVFPRVVIIGSESL